MSQHAESSRSPRRHSPGPAKVTSDMCAAIDKALADRMPSFTKTVTESLNAPVAALVGDLAVAQTKLMEERLKQTDDKVSALDEKVGKIDEKLDELLNKVNISRSSSAPDLGPPPAPRPRTDFQVIGAETVSNPYSQAAADPFGTGRTGFFRDIDQTFLEASTHEQEKVDKDAFIRSFNQLAGEANMGEEHYTISGAAMDNKFRIQFKGEMGTAARRVGHFLLSLKTGRYEYKPQNVSGVDGKQIKLYFNKDKNNAQIRKEIQGKHLKKALEEFCTDHTYYLRRDEALIFVNKKKLAMVEIVSEDVSEVVWNEPFASESKNGLKLDLKEIEKVWEQLVASENIRWSRS